MCYKFRYVLQETLGGLYSEQETHLTLLCKLLAVLIFQLLLYSHIENKVRIKECSCITKKLWDYYLKIHLIATTATRATGFVPLSSPYTIYLYKIAHASFLYSGGRSQALDSHRPTFVCRFLADYKCLLQRDRADLKTLYAMVGNHLAFHPESSLHSGNLGVGILL